MSVVSQRLLPGKKHAPEQLGRVLVLGLGRSGMAAVEYLCALVGTRVTSIFVAAGARTASAEEFAQRFAGENVSFAFDCETFHEHFDMCIASPGISQFSDFYCNAAAASTEIISEAEFAWRESDAHARWVAITGTNGKTTTTSLTAHILTSAGYQAEAVGNIGNTCLSAVGAGGTDVYVAELSSFQLASTVHFAPVASVILNITPDHLYWHKSFEAYAQAKFKCLENLRKESDAVAVLNATDDVVRKKIRELKALSAHERGFDYVALGTASGIRESMIARCGAAAAAYVNKHEVLVVEYAGVRHELCSVADMQIKGDHNISNALAAATVALALGVGDAQVARALQSFAPLEHRNEPCGSIAGVNCFNDSKATNVDSSIKALESFKPHSVVALFGGRDKGTNLDQLVDVAKRYAHAVVCFGECRERFFTAFSENPGTLTLAQAQTLEQALDVALSLAHAGDNLVLSPACASFDEFTCFEQRGEVFKQLVHARSEGRTYSDVCTRGETCASSEAHARSEVRGA